jgi:hypothetical protein
MPATPELETINLRELLRNVSAWARPVDLFSGTNFLASNPVLRISDVYPRSGFFSLPRSRILDPEYRILDPGSTKKKRWP